MVFDIMEGKTLLALGFSLGEMGSVVPGNRGVYLLFKSYHTT